MRFMSIDPGEKGAIVSWEEGTVVDVVNNPYEGKRMSPTMLYNIFDAFKPELIIRENVHTSPRMGVVGAGNFMYSLGIIDAVSSTLGINLFTLAPQRWKNIVGLFGKPKTIALKLVANNLPATYERHVVGFNNALDRAEAILMGEAHLRRVKYNL